MKKVFSLRLMSLSSLAIALLILNSCSKDDDTTLGGVSKITAVDLGLSVKWASCNVGASSPEEYGGYYAWGEIEEKSDYSWSTYKYCNGTYSTCMNIGSDISGTQYDVAHVKWGGSWRMPTHTEFYELYNKCTSTWTTYNGVYGRKFVGPNGNSIFLPAAGYRWGKGVNDQGDFGYYWSGTIGSDNSISAWYLYFNYAYAIPGCSVRHYGFSVRPVSDIVLTADSAFNISMISATITGNVKGVYNVKSTVSIGIVYNTSGSPSVNNGITVASGNTTNGDFSVTLSGLTENATYYYCPYIVVYGKYYYGNVLTFTTKKKPVDIIPGEAIDLGLSVKWASCNVGATTPEGYGGYYAWGETEEKKVYDESTYKYYDSSTKSYIDIGNKISGTQYDVAHVKWGGSWRMPTDKEFEELCNKCTSTWTTYNGVYGRKFVGPNGNSIFLPAAGYRWGKGVNDQGDFGYYWSGTIGSDNSISAW